MSNKTLNELVREQILAEGPEYLADAIPMMREDYVTAQIDNLSNSELLERISEDYVTAQIDNLSNSELLERISDAQRRASVMDIKNWI